MTKRSFAIQSIPFGIAAYFELDNNGKTLIQQLRDINIRTVLDEPGQVIHVSLINGTCIDIEAVGRATAGITVNTDHGTFIGPRQFEERNVLYLAPEAPLDGVIRAANQAICGQLVTLAEVKKFYRPDLFVPHLTIAGGYPDELRRSAAALMRESRYDGRLVGYGLATWRDGVVEILRRWR